MNKFYDIEELELRISNYLSGSCTEEEKETHPSPLNLHLGTLAVGLGCFPFDHGTYLS